jgi:hypothetical protein
MSSTTEGRGEADAAAAIERLEEADAARERERTAVDSVGADRLRRLREYRNDLVGLIETYEDRAKGDGNFEAFIEFQEELARFTEALPVDLLARETFEEIDDVLQRRRLRQKEFDRARDLIASIDDTLEPLSALESAREEYRDARRAVRAGLSTVEDHIADLERLDRLGQADLEAPIDRLSEPIEVYNEVVRAAFCTFRDERPARAVLEFLETTTAYPLVPFEPPPAELATYLVEAEAGTERIPQLLTWADHSRSKLSYSVKDPARFQRVVGGNRSYLSRLSADPLTVDWPPPAAGTLRFRCRSLIAVVDRFADDPVPALRDVRALARREEYERLRESAQATAALTDAERRRLAAGDVSAELRAARDRRERLHAALEDNPEL